MTIRHAAVAVLAAMAALVAAPSVASANTGPDLSVPESALAASLDCSGDLGSGPTPVLLIHGTTLDAATNFDWNYEPALRAVGRAYCTVDLPGNAMADIQVGAEHVVHALRTMSAEAGRRVAVVGFSQGGMIGRWALKYWPDTRADVEDMIGLDPSNHGTLDTYPVCLPGCAPALWQQTTGSAFLRALNGGQETYGGIDYSQLYTITDEVVTPNLPPAASSALDPSGPGRVRNVAVQEVCPVHVADHLSMGSTDPVGYAMVLDALTHDGPVDPGRIDRGVCGALLMPGVDPVAAPANEARYATTIATTLATYPHVATEPELAPYARS